MVIANAQTKTNQQVKVNPEVGYICPATGEELIPVTRETVDRWREQEVKRQQSEAERSRRPPQKIDPEQYAFFDPIGGAARVWYWHAGDEWEFYDNRGFHPRSGDSLTLITRETIEEWRNFQVRKQQCSLSLCTRLSRPLTTRTPLGSPHR